MTKGIGIFMLAAAAAMTVEAAQNFRQPNPLEGGAAAPLNPVVGGKVAVNPVTTSMQCVVSLTIQFFIVYTALAICRTAADAFGLKYDNVPIQKILQTATLTVSFAPMLAILFLACRMRVTQLTKGQGNPPEYVQVAMYFCTYALLLMTLIVCIIPLFTGEVIHVDVHTGEVPDGVTPFENQCCAILFTALKYLILLGLYGGALTVVYGIINYEPPAGIWPAGMDFPVAPAVQCTMILSCQYFLVYGAIQVARSWTQFTGMKMTKFENAMMTATASINFAPMLAVLFIGARMRALQMDPVSGNPQRWAQNCFYMCTYALLAQTICSICVPLVLQGEVKPGKAEGDMEYTVENKTFGTVLAIGRYAMMICIYVGFSCVIYSIFTIEHPNGPQYTPPISVTMQCVINLTFQFFFVYLWIWAAITIKEFTGMEWALMTQTMENCKGAVMYCPMLAILFVGTRMRALMLTNNRGSPPGWAQDGMYMATWALLIQFVMIVITPCATGSPAHVDEDGNIKWQPEHPVLFYIVQAIRWLGYILLYGGVIAVIVSVYTMTPETCNGRGSVPLVGDGKIPGTDAGVPGYDGIKEPVGPNDVVGPKNKGPSADITGAFF
jgi:hypothetical protein